MKFLDCTLRDGGYYNNWDFDPKSAQKLIEQLNAAGVQIIEIGYKTPPNQGSFSGLFKFSSENFLTFLSKEDYSEYAFMIDTNSFMTAGQVNYEYLDAVVLDSVDSPFSWVRLATHFATVETIPAFVSYFRKKGYKVGYNLMGGSLLSHDQIKRGAEIATDTGVDVFYLADSFGSFYPDDIRTLVRFVKQHYAGVMGIHTHDNQGMAYANTLAAIEEGVEFVDGTVTGMGRGAGNLLTEQFLTGYASRYNDNSYNANALLSIIEEYIQPLKDHYKWGFSQTYMYSGLNNIHPTYCQNLIESKRFTVEESSGILARIPIEHRKKFNKATLDEAVKDLIKEEQQEDVASGNVTFDLKEISSSSIIIAARGIKLAPHVENLVLWSKTNKFPLIECNDTGFFKDDVNRYIAILNKLRLSNHMKANTSKATHLISGFPIESEVFKGGFYPFKIGPFSVDADFVQIPDYDAGYYAIALALKAGVKTIYLAGFDGFDKEDENNFRQGHFNELKTLANNMGATIMHLTPTRYNVFDSVSLYDPHFSKTF